MMMKDCHYVNNAIPKETPTPQTIHPASILEKRIDEDEFFCFNFGFSYNVGNHINAIPSSNKAVEHIIDVVVNLFFELILRSSSLKRIAI